MNPVSLPLWLILVLIALALAALAAAFYLARRAARTAAERDQLVARFRGVADADAELARVRAAIAAEENAAKVRREADADEARRQADSAKSRLAAELAAIEARHRQLLAELSLLNGVADADAELARIRAAITAEENTANLRREEVARSLEEARRQADSTRSRIAAELTAIEAKHRQLQAEVSLLDEQAHLFSFGLYTPRFDCSSSAEFAQRLDQVRDRQKAMIKSKTAAVGDIEWSVNGSKTEGRKQINQTLKLLLRAFNGECDAAVAKVRYNNIEVMRARIIKAWEAVNSLAQVQQCRVSRDYLNLKLDELDLEFEYEEKVQAEKEEQRRIREQMREEEIARREIEKARQEAEKEENRAEEALQKARREVAMAQGANAMVEGAKQAALQGKVAELERLLAEAHERRERAISRAEMTRSGHVYVISNIGSFGENVYKIGMTRRLDPYDRIKELGDASVPFDFDIHAVIYADDAPALETELHRSFTEHRVNRVNERKEFFRVSIDAIADAVRRHRGEIEITLMAEAPDYRKTLAILEEDRSRRERSSIPAAVAVLPGARLEPAQY